MTAIVKRIGPNTSGGRDFVVGDVHGCFRTLDQILDQVPFFAGTRDASHRRHPWSGRGNPTRPLREPRRVRART